MEGNAQVSSVNIEDRILKPIYQDHTVILDVSIDCRHINDNIISTLWVETRKKFRRKCVEGGFLLEINNIISYESLPFRPEFNKPTPYFRVTMSNVVVKPMLNQYIFCEIKRFCVDILRCSYGPIEIICSIDKNTLGLLNKKKDIQKYVIIEIVDFKYSFMDTNIKSIGEFVKICEDEDVDKYKDTYFFDYESSV